MDKLTTTLFVKIDGIDITYGRIPSGLIEGWNGIVFYFLTNDVNDIEFHKRLMDKVIAQLEHQSFDHWSEWREVRRQDVVWDKYNQLTLVSFRVKDSY